MKDFPDGYHPTNVMDKILSPQPTGEDNGIPNSIIQASTLTQCFSYVGAIRNAVLSKHGDKNDPRTPIDEQLIPNAVRHLLQLQNRLTLSDAYQDFVIRVTKSATEDLTRNTRFVSSLLRKNCNALTEDQRIKKCQEMHDHIMVFAKAALAEYEDYPQLADTSDAVWVFGHYAPPAVSKLNGEERVTHGSAKMNLDKAPGCDRIDVNTHEEAAIHEALSAMNLTAHETAHVIEGLFAYMYGQNPDLIPPIFRKDAEMLYAMQKQDAYVPSSIYSAYEAQANETLARKAGREAVVILRQAMMDILRKPSAHYIPRNYP